MHIPRSNHQYIFCVQIVPENSLVISGRKDILLSYGGSSLIANTLE